ncbi:MAG: 4Fe-4S dicluster domain-containing protein [Syntrophobacterales bacterium]|nr:MAG: 4Fe-4S dicluster domain-containing protein [Syntrophobacterales bacterium]
MEKPITINRETCTVCGLCEEICPIRLMTKDSEDGISFRPDRLPLCIKCGQCMAVCPPQSIVVDGLAYDRDFFELPPGSASGMPFLEMIQTRRAIRVFKDKPVPRELLEKVVEAITFAPPGFTPLKLEIVVVQDTAVIRQALPEMIKVYETLVKVMSNPIGRFLVRRKAGAAKFKMLEGHVVPLMKSRLPELKEGTEDTITRSAPAMILFHAHRDTENSEGDAHIAVTYGFLAAHALGLGGSAMTIIPPAIENSPVLRELFSIPDSNVVVASMILGYPKYRYQRGIKRKLRGVTWI